jgi:hypothetical protein
MLSYVYSLRILEATCSILGPEPVYILTPVLSFFPQSLQMNVGGNYLRSGHDCVTAFPFQFIIYLITRR